MLTIKNRLNLMMRELAEIADQVDEQACEAMCEAIRSAETIFVTAGGRSFLALKAFAMRLMQIGLRVFVVGEIVTPAIKSGDLLIVASGSGETGGPAANARKAKSVGADVALITARADSTLAKLADVCVIIPVQTEKAADKAAPPSIQPGGNAFEQLTLLLGDALVMELMQDPGRESSVMNLHANLE